jgi:benzoyl-CoA 2,3-dioxygenase component A
MMEVAGQTAVRQHLIDPENCIRCNTCEDTCPKDAITHDNNYVVDADKCNLCLKCIPVCPTGAIDHWRMVPRVGLHGVAAQLGWSALPPEATLAATPAATVAQGQVADAAVAPATASTAASGSQPGSTLPPWSAAHAYTNLYGPTNPVTAAVTGNLRVTQVGKEYDSHLVVLDFGSTPFPVLEGQSLGVIPPGADASGRPHHARQYTISSPRDGERPGFNNLSLTVKRVLEDRQGNAVHGVASNYLCDLKVGDKVQVIGPFGASFLMPNHPRLGADARNDHAAAPVAHCRQIRGWQADAVLRRPNEGGTPVLWWAAQPAEGLHRCRTGLLANRGPTQALRPGCHAITFR